MNIVLIGYRGSGKTAVAGRLAARLGSAMADADEMVIAAAGRSIKEIFAADGEGHFRELETAALADLSRRRDHVIALGGGVVEREENRAMLAAMKAAGHAIVYLRCDAAELLRRIQADPQTTANRPNLTALGGSLAEIDALLGRREPWYRQAMTLELDVSTLTIEQAADHIVRELRKSQSKT